MNNVTVKLLGSTKAITKEIDAIRVSGIELQGRMHVLACSILKHVGAHGDIRPALALVDAFTKAAPDMVRVNSLKLWFETFGQIKFEDNKAVFNKEAKTRLGEAMDKPFWKFKALEGAPYQPIDMSKYMEKEIKRLEKDQEKTGRDHGKLIMALKTHNVDIAVAKPN